MSRYIHEIMTADVITIAPDALLGDAYDLFRHNKISILVVEQKGQAIGLLTERDAVRLIHNNMDALRTTVASVMTSPVIMVDQNLSMFEAYSILTKNHFRHLVVADEQGMLAGVVTLTNMLDGMGIEHFVDLKQISMVMSKNLIRVRPDDSLKLVIDLMFSKQISCVVIADKWKPVGIITERDIVKYYDRDINTENIAISTVMSSPVRTMSDTSYIPEVNQVMRKEKLRHMVVVDKHGCLTGLISQSDLTACMDDGYIAYLKRVIEQKEQKLSKIRQEHESFLKDNPNAVLSLDPSGQILDANPAALRLMGGDIARLRQKYFLDFLHADSANQATTLIDQAYKGVTMHAKLVMRSLSGNDIFVFNSFVPVANENKIISIYIILHDISYEQMAEYRLHQSEQCFHALAQLSSAMSWAIDLTKDCFSHVSKQFEQHLGYPLDSWDNIAIWSERIHVDDREQALSHFAAAQKTGEDHQFLCRMLLSDGSYLPVTTHISVLMQAGHAIEMRGFIYMTGMGETS